MASKKKRVPKALRPSFSKGVIKRMMQSNKEVAKINQLVPFVVSRVAELFIKEMAVEANKYASDAMRNSISITDFYKIVKGSKGFSFLAQHFTDIPEELDTTLTQSSSKKSAPEKQKIKRKMPKPKPKPKKKQKRSKAKSLTELLQEAIAEDSDSEEMKISGSKLGEKSVQNEFPPPRLVIFSIERDETEYD